MKRKKFAIAVAIVFAGSLTAGGIVYFADTKTAHEAGGAALQSSKSASSVSPDNILPISPERDHIFGDPNAPVKIVEYSDTECPYCKQFHQVLYQAVLENGGQVAWVYRHFPLHQIHPKAVLEAEAAECAAELGGNGAFWTFIDQLYKITPSNNNLDLALLPDVAKYAGLDHGAFQECFASERHADRVAEDYNNAVNSGGRSTPFTIIIAKDGRKNSFSGAVAYSSIKSLLDNALK